MRNITKAYRATIRTFDDSTLMIARAPVVVSAFDVTKRNIKNTAFVLSLDVGGEASVQIEMNLADISAMMHELYWTDEGRISQDDVIRIMADSVAHDHTQVSIGYIRYCSCGAVDHRKQERNYYLAFGGQE